MEKLQYLIFDFDGVLINSLNVYISFYADNRRITKGEAKQFLINHTMRNNKSSFIKNLIKNYYSPRLQEYMKTHKAALDEKLLDYITNTPKKKSIVSRNNTNLIKSLLTNKNFANFDYIYGYNNSKSKVDAVKEIITKKKLKNNQILFITDTVGDINELLESDLLQPAQIISVAYGFHKKEVLQNYIDKNQIVDTTKELINKIEKLTKTNKYV